MDSIERLLDKYWNCETSLAEEQALQDFFTSNDVPPQLQQFIPLFAFNHNVKQESLGADFDKKMESLIQRASKEKKYITIKIFEPFLRVAASIIVVGGIGFGLYSITKQGNQVFAETYNDPHIAIKEATLALEKLSSALQLSEEVSKESLMQLHDIDFDWTILDSLTAEMPIQEAAIINNENGEL